MSINDNYLRQEKRCPVCGQVGIGLTFFTNHYFLCGVHWKEMSTVEDIEYELIEDVEDAE